MNDQPPGYPEYKPFDQVEHLGPRPWEDTAKIERWELAHGHDVRLKCYVEFGCQLIVPHERNEAQHQLIAWLAVVGQGSIKGWLLEHAEQAIDNGEIG